MLYKVLYKVEKEEVYSRPEYGLQKMILPYVMVGLVQIQYVLLRKEQEKFCLLFLRREKWDMDLNLEILL